MNSFTSHDAAVSPATLALEQSLKRDEESRVARMSSNTPMIRHHRMIPSRDLKRSRGDSLSGQGASSTSSFDMDSVLQASRHIEEAIAFPPISWPSILDSNDDEEGVDEEVAEPSPKRRCRGLVRSKNSSDLSSLSSLALTTGRFGSNGSMC
jgi:hypothetical protein